MMLHLSSKGHKLSMMNNAQPPSELFIWMSMMIRYNFMYMYMYIVLCICNYILLLLHPVVITSCCYYYCSLQSLENLIHAESYAILLNSMDGQSDDDGALLVPRVVMRNESLIVFRVLLLFRRLWTYTVLAYDCDEHMVMGATHLSNYVYMHTCIHSLT